MRGNQYLFVLYDYDDNTVLAKPMKTCQGKEIATYVTSCYERLIKHDHEVKLFVFDNECSNDLKLAIMKTDTTPRFTDVMWQSVKFVRLRITWLVV